MPAPLRYRDASRIARSVLWALLASTWGCSPGVFDKLMHAVESADAGATAADAGAGPSAADAGVMTMPSMDAATPDAGAQAPSDAGSTDRDARASDDDGGALSDSGPPAGDAGMPSVCPRAQDALQVHVAAYEAGALEVPSFTADRAGFTSTAVGARVVWIFTLPNNTQMAGWGSVQSLLSSPPHLEEPGPFVPLLPVGSVPDGDQAALGSALTLNNREALFFFAPSSWFSSSQPGLARIVVDKPAAEIVVASGALFPQPPAPDGGTAPWIPPFMTGAFVADETAGNFVYVYACQANPDEDAEKSGGALAGPCRVARVSSAKVTDGASYRYWNGVSWVADAHKASVVITGVTGSLSVSYNRYLGKYLAVHTDYPNAIRLQLADHPQGPWKMLMKFPTMESTVLFYTTFGATEHPSLRDACDQVTYVSYIKAWSLGSPDGGTGDLHYDTRLVRVQLQ